MSKGKNKFDTINTQVRDRLKGLLDRYSQAEIARKIGISRSSLNGYLKGTKLPASMCTALVQDLNVNPQWLLTGNGATFLDDVGNETASTATTMLSLVEAMESVMKLKLGSISGDENRKLLHDLHQAIERYENFRADANRMTGPVLHDLVNDIREAASQRNVDRAVSLRKTAWNISRFCDDEQTLGAFMIAEAQVEQLLGNTEKAVKYLRQRFAQWVIQSNDTDESFLLHAFNMVSSTDRIGKRKEALRMCRASIELAREDTKSTQMYTSLQLMCGWLELKLGNIQRAFMLTQINPMDLVDEHAKQWYDEVKMTLLLFAGYLDFDGIAHNWEDSYRKSMMLIQAAQLSENQESLNKALQRYVGSKPNQVLEEHPQARKAIVMLKLLEEPSKQAFEKVSTEIDELVHTGSIVPHVNEYARYEVSATLARLAGEAELARKELLKAEKERLEIPEGETFEIGIESRHYRNALLLIPANTKSPKLRALRLSAEEFFKDYVGRGYGVFHKWMKW